MTIINFDSAFTALLGSEGGYSNDPRDPGGETMYGVTARVARKHGYLGAMRDLPLTLAKTIAKAEYWDAYQCDQFDPRVAFHVFDAAYNGGHPGLWLQEATGATADGVIGAQTISGVRAANPDRVMRRFGALRQLYLADLPTWPAFSRGWMRRLANNQLQT